SPQPPAPPPDASAPDPAEPPRPFSRRARVAAVGGALALLTAAALIFFGPWLTAPDPPPARPGPYREDPRLAYGGPCRNVHPDVRYVGDQACSRCHAEIADSYRHHPMGRSLAPIAAVAATQAYTAEHNNPFRALSSTFLVDRQGG